MSTTPCRYMSEAYNANHSKHLSTTRRLRRLRRTRQLGQVLCVGLVVTALADVAMGRSEYLDTDLSPVGVGSEDNNQDPSTGDLGSWSMQIEPGLIPGTDLVDPLWSLPLTMGFTSTGPEELVRFESQEYWYDASHTAGEEEGEAFEWFGWVVGDNDPELTIGVPDPYESLRAMDEAGYRSTSWMVGQATLGVVPLPSAVWQGGAVLVGLGMWRWTRCTSRSCVVGYGKRSPQLCDIA